jgi:hypothetical protein
MLVHSVSAAGPSSAAEHGDERLDVLVLISVVAT